MKKMQRVLLLSVLSLGLVFGVVQFSNAGEGSIKGGTHSEYYLIGDSLQDVAHVTTFTCGTCNGGIIEFLLSQCRCVDTIIVEWY